MKRVSKYAFKPTDIHFSNEFPFFMQNKKLDDGIDWLVRQFVPMWDYLIKPARYLLNYIGRVILRLMGINKIEGRAIRLKDYPVKMRDGAICVTDIYLPEEVYKNKTKAPTILVRSPYWKNMVALLAHLVAAKGYVVVLQDIRGTATSIPYGTMAFTYLIPQDGFDTLDWLTKRFWYNGKIAMWGLSFLGVTQLGIYSSTDKVTCFNPTQCAHHNPFHASGGLMNFGLEVSILRLLLGITQNIDPSLTSMMHGEEGVDERIYYNPLLSLYNDPIETNRYVLTLEEMAKIDEIEKLTGILNKTFDLNLRPNARDDGSFTKFLLVGLLARRINLDYDYLPYSFNWDPTKMTTPTLAICSWYDFFLESTLLDVKRIQRENPEYFQTKYKLIIGPGGHAGLDLLENFFLKSRNLFELFQQFIPMWWFEHWLDGDGHELTKVAPIRLYVMNKGIWRNVSKWPPKCQEIKFYLHSNGKANSLSGDGKLLEGEPTTQPADEFDFNPSNPVPTRGGRFLMLRSGDLNQVTIEKRKDVLIYTTDKLQEGIEVIGEVKLLLYASSSAKDTDFMVKLVDVHNNRKATNVVDGGVRARFREGRNNPSLIESDKIYKYEIEVGSTAIYFPKGHKIRVEITSSNFPRFQVNSNLAGEKEGYYIAHQKIFHNSEYPSYLVLPIFRRY